MELKLLVKPELCQNCKNNIDIKVKIESYESDEPEDILISKCKYDIPNILVDNDPDYMTIINCDKKETDNEEINYI